VKLKLVAGWDAALTYDALRKRSEDGPSDRHRTDGDPVFVGREELLGSLVDAISEPDRRGTYLVSGYRGAGKMADFLEPHDPTQAKAIYAAAAARGDPEALVHVVLSVPDRPSQELVDKLVATRDWAAIGRAGREVADSEAARILLVAAAENKHVPSMAELVIRSPMYGGVEGTRWNDALIASGDGSELFRAASELAGSDPQQALVLMIEAANFEHEEAMAEVVIRSPANADAAQTNLNRLNKLRRWDLLEAAARGVEAYDPERAATIRAVVEARRDGEHGQPPAEGNAPDHAA